MGLTNTKAKTLLSQLLRDRNTVEILRGAGIALGLRGSAVIAGYAVIFSISRIYGAHGVGIYSLSMAMLAMMEIGVGLGFKMASVRIVPEYMTRGSLSVIKRVYLTMLLMTLALALIATIALLTGSRWLAENVFGDPALAKGFMAAAFTLPLVVANGINVETIRGFRRLHLSEYLRDLNTLVFTLLGVLLLWGTFVSETLPVWCYGAGTAVSCAASGAYLFARIGRVPVAKVDTLSPRALLTFALPMMAMQFMSVYLGRVETLLVGWLSSTRDVGLYSAAFKLASVTNLLVTSVNMIGAPKIAELYWSGDRPGLVRSVRLCSALMFWTSAPIILFMMVTARFWLGLMGDDFRAGSSALVIIAVGQLVNALCGPAGVFLNMTGHQHILRNIAFVALVVNISTGLLVIPRLGMLGAALVSMVTLIIVNTLAAAYVWREDRICTAYFPFLRTRCNSAL